MGDYEVSGTGGHLPLEQYTLLLFFFWYDIVNMGTRRMKKKKKKYLTVAVCYRLYPLYEHQYRAIFFLRLFSSKYINSLRWIVNNPSMFLSSSF